MKLMKKAAVNVATLQAIASGAATGAPLHLKSVSAHFMFGPRLLHTSNIIFKKCAPLWFLAPLAAKSWRRACHTPNKNLLSATLASWNLKNWFRRFVPHIIYNNNQFSTPEKENFHCYLLQSFALILLLRSFVSGIVKKRALNQNKNNAYRNVGNCPYSQHFGPPK